MNNMLAKILAIDTSGQTMSVAVLDGQNVLAEINTNSGRKHAEGLMRAIDYCLKLAGIGLQDGIAAVACASGPGSFTGLRIGVSAVKGIAHGVGLGVIGVPTLDALAYNAKTPPVVPIMDARRGQVYTSMYDYIDGVPMRLREYSCVQIDDVLKILDLLDVRATFTGDAAIIHKELLESRGHSISPELFVRASSVGRAALKLLGDGGFPTSPHDLVPFYLRKPQAERELLARQGGL